MKVTSLISTLLLGSCALARPLDEPTLEERQSGGQKVFTTTGVAGTVYPRLEVREMKDTKPNQYTLLIVALNRWMKQSQTDFNGYFQFASIHGVPRDPYNNVGQCANQACKDTDGYGVHDNVLFPTWHRAYLATFEQRFLNIVRNVASEYPAAQRPTMIAAANQMRWPFYDSAIRPQNGKPAFPLLMSDVTVTVNGPKGKMTITNPLFRFDIPDPSGFVYAHFTEWKRTFRYPNTNDPNAASQTQSVVNAFANIRQNLADQFYNMFTNCHDYLHFSNDQAGSSIPSCATSVEDIHNAIHNAIGGTGNQDTGLSGGHMTYLPISSYDPAFWLHHSNIDRIFAMWQRINPNSWISEQVAPTASWTIAQGTRVNSGSDLTPFYRTDGKFWTSDQVRDWTVFGYTYSDFTVTDGSASAINSRINGLYGPNANIVVAKRDAEPQILDTLESMGSGVTDTVKNVVDGVEGAIGDLINPLTAHNGSTFQYVANIFTPRYALNGSYNIFLFNDVPSSELTSTWITDPKLIGMMGVTSKPNMVDNPLIASGSIPLTRALQDSVNSSFLGGVLSDLTEALVVPYLTQKLQWRVQGPLGENIDPGTIEGFVVSVFASSAAPHNDDELPQYSEFINLLDVTKSQSGGANNSEQVAPPTISIPALPVSLPSYSSY